MAPVALFQTWLQAFQASPTFKRSSVALAPSRVVLREAPAGQALANLSKEPDSILVFASEPDWQISAIHNVKDIGSNRFHPQETPFAILGFLNHEIAVTFKPSTFFSTIPTTRTRAPRVPADISTLLATDTAEKLAALPNIGASNETWPTWTPKHCILVPVFLAEALSKHENADPTTGFLAIRHEIAKVYDEAQQNPEMGPDDIDELFSILQWSVLGLAVISII